MEAVYHVCSTALRRDYNRARSRVNSVLNAVHSVLTVLIACLAFAFAAAAVESARWMLVSIERLLAVKLTAAAQLVAADASN